MSVKLFSIVSLSWLCTSCQLLQLPAAMAQGDAPEDNEIYDLDMNTLKLLSKLGSYAYLQLLTAAKRQNSYVTPDYSKYVEGDALVPPSEEAPVTWGNEQQQSEKQEVYTLAIPIPNHPALSSDSLTQTDALGKDDSYGRPNYSSHPQVDLQPPTADATVLYFYGNDKIPSTRGPSYSLPVYNTKDTLKPEDYMQAPSVNAPLSSDQFGSPVSTTNPPSYTIPDYTQEGHELSPPSVFAPVRRFYQSSLIAPIGKEQDRKIEVVKLPRLLTSLYKLDTPREPRVINTTKGSSNLIENDTADTATGILDNMDEVEDNVHSVNSTHDSEITDLTNSPVEVTHFIIRPLSLDYNDGNIEDRSGNFMRIFEEKKQETPENSNFSSRKVTAIPSFILDQLSHDLNMTFLMFEDMSSIVPRSNQSIPLDLLAHSVFYGEEPSTLHDLQSGSENGFKPLSVDLHVCQDCVSSDTARQSQRSKRATFRSQSSRTPKADFKVPDYSSDSERDLQSLHDSDLSGFKVPLTYTSLYDSLDDLIPPSTTTKPSRFPSTTSSVSSDPDNPLDNYNVAPPAPPPSSLAVRPPAPPPYVPSAGIEETIPVDTGPSPLELVVKDAFNFLRNTLSVNRDTRVPADESFSSPASHGNPFSIKGIKGFFDSFKGGKGNAGSACEIKGPFTKGQRYSCGPQTSYDRPVSSYPSDSSYYGQGGGIVPPSIGYGQQNLPLSGINSQLIGQPGLVPLSGVNYQQGLVPLSGIAPQVVPLTGVDPHLIGGQGLLPTTGISPHLISQQELINLGAIQPQVIPISSLGGSGTSLPIHIQQGLHGLGGNIGQFGTTYPQGSGYSPEELELLINQLALQNVLGGTYPGNKPQPTEQEIEILQALIQHLVRQNQLGEQILQSIKQTDQKPTNEININIPTTFPLVGGSHPISTHTLAPPPTYPNSYQSKPTYSGPSTSLGASHVTKLPPVQGYRPPDVYPSSYSQVHPQRETSVYSKVTSTDRWVWGHR